MPDDPRVLEIRAAVRARLGDRAGAIVDHEQRLPLERDEGRRREIRAEIARLRALEKP